MLGKNHLLTSSAGWCVLGVPALGLAGVAVTPAVVVAGAVVCAGASMLPDLDHPQATVSRVFGPVSQAFSRGVAKLAGGHRQGTHSLFAAALLVLGLGWLLAATDGPWIALGLTVFCTALMVRVLTETRGLEGLLLSVLIGAGMSALAPGESWLLVAIGFGYVAHIVGDMLTPEGAPLFKGLSKRRFRLPIIGHTGDWRETLIGGVSGCFVVWVAVTAVFLPVFSAPAPQLSATPSASTTQGVERALERAQARLGRR
jgi:membrane-bound metal-dependent hydrolase YbcI (DUF457 family)